MNKGKSTWKYNKLLMGRRNYFDGLSGSSQIIQALYNSPDKSKVGLTNLPYQLAFENNKSNNRFWNSDEGKAATNAGINMAGSLAGGLISDGYSTTAGNVMNNLSSVASLIPGWGTAAAAGLKVGAGLANRAFGVKWNEENIANVENNIRDLNNFQSNAGDWDTLASNWSNAATGMTFNNNYIGKNGWFTGDKVGSKANDLRNQITNGENHVYNTLINNATSISKQQMNNMLANNITAYGGSIHIKSGNKGKFTETKKRTGKTTEELTHSKNPLTRKRAIFAQNAAKWKHEDGGSLYPELMAYGGELHSQGGNFTNGIISINNGDSHENNPNEGVQIGVDPQGVPNLVEEGENIFNNYVYSKRINVPKAIRNKYKLGGVKNISFADASKKLSKESEERPNDPISKNGLEAIMYDLAESQEKVKAEQYPVIEAPNIAAYGGNLFTIGGQYLNYDNSSTPSFEENPNFKYQNEDGAINFDIMYGEDSPYINRINYVLSNWETPEIAEWKKNYIEFINSYNRDRNDWENITDISKEEFQNNTKDRKWGAMHAGVIYTGDPQKKEVTKHKLRDKNGATDMPEEAWYITGIDPETGYSWKDKWGNKYSIVNGGNPTEDYNPETHTLTKTYWYDPVKNTSKTNRYYIKNNEGTYDLIEGDDPLSVLKNSYPNYTQKDRVANTLNGEDFYYDPQKISKEPKVLSTNSRYLPIVGLAGSVITDALGVTNKPDYSEANAVLNAAKLAGQYQPVRHTPIGNYLTYKPFDRDYYLNRMDAAQNAAMRNVMNTSGGNRATAQAGIMALTNNYLDKTGELARQGEEYNLAQRDKVATFNKDTDKFNVTNALAAAEANQRALAAANSAYFSGAANAAEIRQKERLAADAAKSANLSGLFTSLGNIGRENMAWNWRNFGLNTETWGNAGTNPYANLLGDVRVAETNNAAKGGKINKKKKGLTI